MLKNKIIQSLCVLFPIYALTGCMVGPIYQTPKMTMPTQFKALAGWKVAEPKDTEARGAWWEVYQDPILNQLEQQVQISNQNVAQYVAKYQQAAALVSSSRSGLFPTVTATPSVTRAEKASSSSSSDRVSNSYTASIGASWELDLWGKLRRQVDENKASAVASQADLANATLSAQSTLAQSYFALRILDQRIDLYDYTISIYEKYCRILAEKYKEGIIAKSDLTQAEQSLYSAQASKQDLSWQRAQYEHAIAVLIGKAPATFDLAKQVHLKLYVPEVPHTVPSELLERRPDIAASERRVAAANEAIGIAIAGYFPSLSLSSSMGSSSSHFSQLFSASTAIWSLGASASQTLFDFGANKAKVVSSRAAYDETVASYKQTVLDAMQAVEDSLVKSSSLKLQLQAQQKALQASTESARIYRNQYDEGLIDYANVATTEATRLTSQQSILQTQSTQLQNSVALIVALGGGWHTAQ
ncbi:efflux transporter outer membrane subunit [Acinetobacter boissieri]|uniref:Efflux transporter, outer membrane factor (OMF) lipoprotein, NodT family n=1 Tax=Acinetobacter boissieri TaxID=1219383 RepID=A0A1G6IHW9_9GAMM|nr:efflux transporter outer membrane subunit [Acinetobacter boissieri]SDC05993.1 efflux transporter, outer membrane factor (OMF) lipoprotein, NodT family [Acinetobacter boissieri]